VLFQTVRGAEVNGWETDRARFLGRGRDAGRPQFGFGGGTGNVLDPVLALRAPLTLRPGEAHSIDWFLGVTEDAAAAARMAVELRTGADAPAERWFPSEPMEVVPFADLAPITTVRMRGTTRAPIAEPLKAFNGYGGFSANGTEYVIGLPWTGTELRLPPLPWCNVISNKQFGFLVTETGAGATWSRNSQANRLTPWSNDPVSDPHGEAVYLRDEESGALMSLFAGPTPAEAGYTMTHGFGYSQANVVVDGLSVETVVFADLEMPVKVTRCRLRNTGDAARRLSLWSYHQLVLGNRTGAALEARMDGNGVMKARRMAQGPFADGEVFCTWLLPSGPQSWTTCRTAFVGNGDGLKAPEALLTGRFLESAEPGNDCIALRYELALAPGQTVDAVMLFGEMTDGHALERFLQKSRKPGWTETALSEVRAFWREMLTRVQVETPMPELDAMLNGWLPYQALACRLWARTAYYQSSGAFGFRDQLQDAGNLALIWPELTRDQITLHAAQQFEEGDVLHWWHPAPIGAGVRTRFADDRLWLPFVVAEYVGATGDSAVLGERVQFLAAPPLDAGEEERYFQPAVSDHDGTIYEHCCRAIECSLQRGVHGLPLFGTGDWNDGMNRVGRLGKGESVWMAFFLHRILTCFAPLAGRQGDHERAVRYGRIADSLATAVNQQAWDGAWYLRGYYDNGTPLGGTQAKECRIDAIAQAWAVLSGVAPRERAETALAAAERELVDASNGLIKLLAPPFVETAEDPGYIKGYVAGVRENGGQYTHAACWMVQAASVLGWRDRAAAWFSCLSPLWHTADAIRVDHYKVEPYVIVADIYGVPPHTGRGGWSWYTGSAGWAFRVAVESLLGVRLEDGTHLVVKPAIPDTWSRCQVALRPGLTPTTEYRITLSNPSGCASRVVAVEWDGKQIPPDNGTARVPLARDGKQHLLSITLGR
jgi:cyclic beta-1,2-glucan synthetase